MIRVASLFSQLLAHFPRTECAGLVVKHGRSGGEGIYMLDADCGHVVLSSGSGGFAAGDLQRVGQLPRQVGALGAEAGAERVHAVLRHRGLTL